MLQGQPWKPMSLTCLPDHRDTKWALKKKMTKMDRRSNQQWICRIFIRSEENIKVGS